MNGATATELGLGGRFLVLDRPRVMAVLNTTPDSFSDGGRFLEREAALRHARQMVADGADIIDVGGESTRPGAAAVGVQEELDRVVPVVEAICAELPVAVSVDTSKPEVMHEAVRAGAGLINDIYALRREGALAAAAELDVAVCLMHMRGEPQTMQEAPAYTDVVAEVRGFLRERVEAAVAAGIARENLIVDPGFGFGKTLAHNLSLLKHLGRFAELGVPLLAGLSRKSMVGAVLDGRPVDGRLYGGVAAAVLAARSGAAILRVHDVGPTVDALRLVAAVLGAE